MSLGLSYLGASVDDGRARGEAANPTEPKGHSLDANYKNTRHQPPRSVRGAVAAGTASASELFWEVGGAKITKGYAFSDTSGGQQAVQLTRKRRHTNSDRMQNRHERGPDPPRGYRGECCHVRRMRLRRTHTHTTHRKMHGGICAAVGARQPRVLRVGNPGSLRTTAWIDRVCRGNHSQDRNARLRGNTTLRVVYL